MDHCSDHAAHERAIGVHDARLDAHGEAIDDMKLCIEKLTILQEEQQEWRRVADERISALESKPGMRWEAATSQLLNIALTLALGALAVAIGLNA